ncbi:TadE/TadG family type IV pilus assembly protein [Prosthecomicrobium sp. N25]|uniref:TadE/TadG family type IV pilus assembly protein n=1 Tax=Prosthecomicrobium sp. N25 TaxID=3129254 RepID=UPI0030778A0B
MLASFRQARGGNVAMTFSLMLAPLMLLGGATIDLGLVFSERSRAQNALDRATLAAGADLGLVPNEQVIAKLKAIYDETFVAPPSSTTTIKSVSINSEKGEITAVAEVKTRTTFLRFASIDEMTSQFSATVALGINDFDVVMVLDNSGSMAGSKIASLKTAAKDLVSTLLSINTVGSRTDRVQIGVVPFAASVNVGASFGPTYSGTTRTGNGTGSAWLDVNGVSSVHQENFNTGLTDNRFDLFARLAAARPTSAAALSWGGCVEVRPQPYDVTDDAPDASKPDTFYVPMFAPDEPGYKPATSSSWTNPSGFSNNYLDDNGGSCTTAASSSSNTALLEAQGRTCKYRAPTSANFRNASSLGDAFGPNFSCTTKPVQPMSRTKATLDTFIDSLAANGNTNIHEGVMWGWHALSPAAPFTEGRTGTMERPLKKFMIVMTDGENTYGTNTSVNKSTYAAYGFVSKNRLGTTNTSSVKTKQDERTALACQNAKNDGGITVYTIAFQVSATATQTLLRNCATSPGYYYPAESNSQLIAVFQQIAREISQLRVAK